MGRDQTSLLPAQSLRRSFNETLQCEKRFTRSVKHRKIKEIHLYENHCISRRAQPQRDVSLISGAGICRTLRERGHQAFLLDVFFGLPYDPDRLEEVFSLPDSGLSIAEGIKTTTPDLAALKAARPDQSDCYLGPNVIELCRMADITFMALHGSVGENGKLQATFDILGIKYTGPNSLGCSLSMNKLVAKQVFKMSQEFQHQEGLP